MTDISRADFFALRNQFGRLPRNECHKQIGLRHIRDGLMLLANNPVYAQELLDSAAFHLSMAKALHAITTARETV